MHLIKETRFKLKRGNLKIISLFKYVSKLKELMQPLLKYQSLSKFISLVNIGYLISYVFFYAYN